MADILVVDDNATNRLLLATILELGHHVIHEAEDGEDALRFMSAQRPHLVILDLNMPGMPGTELIKHMRRDPELAKIPLMLYTASPTTPSFEQFCEANAIAGVIPKPSEPEEVLRLVSSVLAMR